MSLLDRELPIYLAPEIFEGKACTKESDVYAFGVIAWEVPCCYRQRCSY